MFLKIYVVCAVFVICETAKIGLGNGNNGNNGRTEPSSLKSEVMKFKTSECGGSSSEEDNYHHKANKRRGTGNHRNKKESDEDDDESDESEENNNKKKKGGKNRNNNNRGRNKNRGLNDRKDHDSYSSSFEGGHFGMMERRPPNDDFFNRRPGQGADPYNPWDMNPNRPNNQYPNRQNPYPFDGFFPQGQAGNKRPPMGNGQNPYGYPSRGGEQDPYGNNGGHRYNNRDAGNPWSNGGNRNRDEERYNNRGDRDRNEDRYNTRRNGDRYNNRGNRDDRYNTRNRNNYGDDYDDSNSGGNRSNGHNNRGSGRNNNKKGKNGRKSNKNQSGEECVSQCVFTNMEIMEDDGIPSEAGMIKWAQDKIKNEKLKQAAVKEIRKCFGTLASSDGENSCNFSKSLAACLKLGLDEDKDDD